MIVRQSPSKDRSGTNFHIQNISPKYSSLAVALLLLLFGVYIHDPFSSISDDIRPITIMENYYTKGTLDLRDVPGGKIGINEALGADGKVYSASLLGPSFWYYPAFLVGKALNKVVAVPSEMVPRANWIYTGSSSASRFSNSGRGDWAPIFARLMNGLLLPIMYFLLVKTARLYNGSSTSSHIFALLTLFGTQLLLLNHSNYDHTLNAFGLLMAFYFAINLAKSPTWSNALFCGIGLAISVTTRQFSMVYLPIFAGYVGFSLYRTGSLRFLQFLGFPVVCGVILNLWYNWIRTGSAISSGYDEKWIQFDPIWIGMYRYALTLDHSVLLHSPLLVVGLFLWIATFKRIQDLDYIFPLLLIIIHCTFYLCWHYPGGTIVPLRFFTEVFFLIMLPLSNIAASTSRKAVVAILGGIGFVNSVVLSFTNFRRTPPGPDSFFTWRTPVIPEDFRIQNELTQLMANAIMNAWHYGWPDWFGLHLFGVKGAVLLLTLLGIVIFSIFKLRTQVDRTALKPLTAITLLCFFATLMLLLVTVPYKHTDMRISSDQLEIRNINLEHKRGSLLMTGEYGSRTQKALGYRLHLRSTTFPEVQYCCSSFLKFGAEFLKSDSLPVASTRNDLARFREVVQLPEYLPPDKYEAYLQTSDDSGGVLIGSVQISNRLEYTVAEAIIPAEDWFRSSSCEANDIGDAVLDKGEAITTTIRLPAGRPERLQYSLYIGALDKGAVTLLANGIASAIVADDGIQLGQINLDDSQLLVLTIRCDTGRYLFSGLALKTR